MRLRTAPTTAALPLDTRAAWRGALLIVLLTLCLVAVARSDTAHALLGSVIESFRTSIVDHPVAGPLLFVALSALSAMLAFASVALLIPLAIAVWGEQPTMLLLWSGWLLGGLCSYWAGRRLGRGLVRWLAADAMLERLETYLGPSTPFAVVLLLQLALPSEIPGYVLGLVRYSMPRYIVALGLAELMYTLAAVQLGTSFVERRTAMMLATGIAVSALSLTAFYVWRRITRY